MGFLQKPPNQDLGYPHRARGRQGCTRRVGGMSNDTYTSYVETTIGYGEPGKNRTMPRGASLPRARGHLKRDFSESLSPSSGS